jgi:hypothetical protein
MNNTYREKGWEYARRQLKKPRRHRKYMGEFRLSIIEVWKMEAQMERDIKFINECAGND